MFGLFSSPDRTARAAAAHWLEVAESVWNLRRDLLKETDRAELDKRRGELKGLLKAKEKAAVLEASIKRLEETLKKTGGVVYPRGSLAENVEFFVMAALVILGFRTYFFGNFEIPTNSMWPTFHGMTAEIFPSRSEEPGAVVETARRLLVGAVPHRLDAPVDGEVVIPIGGNDAGRGGWVHYRVVPGHTWLVLPALVKEYTLYVDNEPVRVQVPLDFDFDWVVFDAFLGKGMRYSPRLFASLMEDRFKSGDAEVRWVDGDRRAFYKTGVHVHAGDRILAFDQESGDKLFVDRISYNFIRPPVGSGFVFRTGNIPELAREDGDVFFVKRLVGIPGDTLEVKGTTLYRNGKPITGASAFDANAAQKGQYPGYEAIGLLAKGETVTVPPHGFFAMGDNSPNSKDSRYWGFVPEKDVVGRPVLVYYPISKRFGFAH